MKQDVIIHYDTPSAREDAVRGMLNAKQEWLSYVQHRKEELGFR